MIHDFRFPALVTLGVVVLLFGAAANVGRVRFKHRIEPPVTAGPPEFERAFRVQMNTVENALLFLPAFWVFTVFVSEIWASTLGIFWLASRVWYCVAYQKLASRRGAPFALSMLAIVVLVLGGLWGVLRTFI